MKRQVSLVMNVLPLYKMTPDLVV